MSPDLAFVQTAMDNVQRTRVHFMIQSRRIVQSEGGGVAQSNARILRKGQFRFVPGSKFASSSRLMVGASQQTPRHVYV